MKWKATIFFSSSHALHLCWVLFPKTEFKKEHNKTSGTTGHFVHSIFITLADSIKFEINYTINKHW